MTNATRWAVLLCRYSDDTNDPTTTTIQDLAAQNPGAPWALPAWTTNTNTILEEYQRFFTLAGASTNNMPNFFTTMSHGTVGLGAQVFPCQLDRTLAEATQLANITEPGSAFQEDNFKLAKKAWQEQWSVDPDQFYAVIVSFQNPDWGSQGGTYAGGPGVYMDIRYVLNNGSMRWGHEMGHAFGLDHSRADTQDPNFNPAHCPDGPPDYRDPWDTMSAECTFFTADPDYTSKGPGFNAWNMRSRGWLDETRTWHCPTEIFSQVLTLRPLHRLDLNGSVAAELPPYKATGSFPRYLVEFRLRRDWDAGIPRSCVQVHRLDGPVGQFLGTHSYVEMSLANTADLVDGDIFAPGAQPNKPAPVLRVLKIDEANESAQIHLSFLPPFLSACSAANQDGRIEIFCIAADQTIHHLWQTSPNNGWTSQFPRMGNGNTAKSITMLNNAQQELEIFYVGTDNHLYHNWQSGPNGNWNGEARISNDNSAKQIVAAKNADGTLQIFYQGTNDELYYNVQKPNKKWYGENKLGNPIQKLAVAPNQNGSLELCLIGTDGKLYRRRQTGANQVDGWGALTSLGVSALDLAVIACPDQLLELIFIDSGARLMHMVQDGSNGAWNNAEQIQPQAKAFAACVNANGLLELFFTDLNNDLHHCQQIELHQWNRKSDAFQAAALQLLLEQNQDGHLELMYVGTDNGLYHNWQVGMTGTWAGEEPF